MRKSKIINEINYLIDKNEKIHEIEKIEICKRLKEECKNLKKSKNTYELQKNIEKIVNMIINIKKEKEERYFKITAMKATANSLKQPKLIKGKTNE